MFHQTQLFVISNKKSAVITENYRNSFQKTKNSFVDVENAIFGYFMFSDYSFGNTQLSFFFYLLLNSIEYILG